MSTEKPTLSDFEQSLDELEKLVRTLEQGELSLEHSLAAFEQGVGLTRSCQKALRDAEQRVQLVIEQNDGSIDSKPFPESAPGQLGTDSPETPGQ